MFCFARSRAIHRRKIGEKCPFFLDLKEPEGSVKERKRLELLAEEEAEGGAIEVAAEEEEEEEEEKVVAVSTEKGRKKVPSVKGSRAARVVVDDDEDEEEVNAHDDNDEDEVRSVWSFVLPSSHTNLSSSHLVSSRLVLPILDSPSPTFHIHLQQTKARETSLLFSFYQIRFDEDDEEDDAIKADPSHGRRRRRCSGRGCGDGECRRRGGGHDGAGRRR